MSGSDEIPQRDAIILRWFTIDLVVVVLTQKVAISLGGSGQLAVALIIHLLIVAWLIGQNVMSISGPRMVAFCVFAGTASLLQIRFPTPSFASLGLMLVTAASLLFVTDIRRATYHALLRRFVAVALVAVALVQVDWMMQGIGLPMPNLEVLLPEDLIYHSYNYIQPLTYGSPWMKPNGIIFLETSHVSQFIAMGLIVEIAMFRRPFVLIALAVGLISTFGGTGITLVAACAPFLLVRAGSRFALVALLSLPFVLAFASLTGVAENLEGRSSEFTQGSSSGYNRFVLPFEWTVVALTGPQDAAWLGEGAGTMPKAETDAAEGGYAWPPYAKITVEYGILVLLGWFVFMSVSLFGREIPFVISWMVFIQFNLLNGSLNVPIHTIYCVLLCAGFTFSANAVPVRKYAADAQIRRLKGFLQTS